MRLLFHTHIRYIKEFREYFSMANRDLLSIFIGEILEQLGLNPSNAKTGI